MQTDGLTLTIEGGDRWTKPQTPREQRTMSVLTKLAGDPTGCCGTCAFREGTEANRSQLVLHLIESCLLDDGNTFMCHEAERPCTGFVRLARREIATVAEARDIVRENAEKDPAYAPYCLRCSTMARMTTVEPFFWRCASCGAEHDAREGSTLIAMREAEGGAE